jgi:hypothetical protein
VPQGTSDAVMAQTGTGKKERNIQIMMFSLFNGFGTMFVSEMNNHDG